MPEYYISLLDLFSILYQKKKSAKLHICLRMRGAVLYTASKTFCNQKYCHVHGLRVRRRYTYPTFVLTQRSFKEKIQEMYDQGLILRRRYIKLCRRPRREIINKHGIDVLRNLPAEDLDAPSPRVANTGTAESAPAVENSSPKKCSNAEDSKSSTSFVLSTKRSHPEESKDFPSYESALSPTHKIKVQLSDIHDSNDLPLSNHSNNDESFGDLLSPLGYFPHCSESIWEDCKFSPDFTSFQPNVSRRESFFSIGRDQESDDVGLAGLLPELSAQKPDDELSSFGLCAGAEEDENSLRLSHDDEESNIIMPHESSSGKDMP